MSDGTTAAPSVAPAASSTTVAAATTSAATSTQPAETEPAATEPTEVERPTTSSAGDSVPVDSSATSGATADDALTAPDGDAFYDAPDPLPGDAPGDVIWTRELEDVPDGARGWLVLYRSLDVQGNPIPVSGVVVAPAEPATDAGVVFTWAHGTTGVGDECAPSKFDFTIETAAPIVAKGWTFVATDYEGLGTEGVHPYLVGHSEGRGVLDIVRAAAQIDGSGATAESQVVISGHSQGGHASLMAAEIAPTYAPELDLVGAIGIAPPGELNFIAGSLPAVGRGFVLMAIAGFLDAYPDLPLDAVANEEWLPLIEEVADACISEAFEIASQATGPRPDQSLNPEWSAVLEENSPARVAPAVPLLIVHGDADDVVPIVLSQFIHARYCGLGVTSQHAVYPGADHSSVVAEADGDMMSWIADRLAGLPAPANCGR